MTELIVTLTIIGILASLLLPAIQYARDAARRTQCQNNLRQLALACQNFEAAHRSLPPYYDRPMKSNPARYGVRGADGDFDDLGYSWRMHLLPFMEQGALHDKFDWSAQPWEPVNEHLASTVVPTFLCPTNPRPTWDKNLLLEGGLNWPYEDITVAISEYTAFLGIFIAYDPYDSHFRLHNGGPYMDDPPDMELRRAGVKHIRWGVWGDADVNSLWNLDWNLQAMCQSVRGYTPGRFSSVTDGLAHTILLVEEGAKPRWIDPRLRTDEFYHHASWQESPAISESFHRFENTINYSNHMGIYSLHSGGANVAMADGSVVFLSQELEYRELVRLYTCAGGIDE